MIQYVKRKDLDVEKYDACIEKSLQSNIYGYSWYLDIVCDNWDVLVLEDYCAVMPIPWKKKLFIKYVHPPFWLIQLGIYSVEVVDENEFLIELFDDFKFVETRTNIHNAFSMFKAYEKESYLQVLSLEDDYEVLFSNYRKDRRKDVSKAKKLDLIEKWNDDSKVLIELFKNNVGKRTPYIQEVDYNKLQKLITVCLEKRVGEILSIYDKENNLVASGFFLKHKKAITILVSSTDFKNRKNGANTFLIDRAIYKFEKNFNVFNFGGSSLQTIAKYFLSFGALTLKYPQIKYNKLPWFIKLLRKMS
ncbi:hypothetical protein [Polaribacter atrinae]|uniref:BioF2-like acetyltransferase domain-containing protein n=1 Tax=Polaribacter atrinae TaxID=1333662 RepID=A0A176T4Y5_9FLAO|nr:hypothetical protein [Polaribacter atrinae]OAD42984.1 hypothetical protein LPB303_14005 [Polaribacter atrinae]